MLLTDRLRLDDTACTGPLTRSITKVLTVTNPHEFSIAFKVKTTAPKVCHFLLPRSRQCLINSGFRINCYVSCMSSGLTLDVSSLERASKSRVCAALFVGSLTCRIGFASLVLSAFDMTGDAVRSDSAGNERGTSRRHKVQGQILNSDYISCWRS